MIDCSKKYCLNEYGTGRKCCCKRYEVWGIVRRYEKLNWRMVARAGGATVKPDDFYRLYALHMQVRGAFKVMAILV